MRSNSLNGEKTMRRKRAVDEELNSLEAFNKSIIDSISDALLVIDPSDFTIISANQAALKQLKLQREEVVGRFCYEATHHTSTPCKLPNDVCPIYDLLKTGNSVSVEHTHFDKEENKIYVEVSAHSIRNREGKTVLVTHIAKDVTERKLMQEKLLNSERLATVGELALTLANDLRNPLQAIQSAAYWLKNDYSHLQNSPAGIKMLQIINDSIRYSDNIVKGLLDFGSSKTPIIKKMDVNAVIKKALEQIEIPKNVELITELGDIPQIEADEDMLKQVFLNLTKNGIESMENGGALRVSTRGTAGFVAVSFRDTGIGVSRENLDKLFKPLFTTKSKGMGLGLAICKRLIEAHEGSIEVESGEGKGTEFRVKLQIHQSEVKSQSAVNSNILVVDNGTDVFESLRKIVQQRNEEPKKAPLRSTIFWVICSNSKNLNYCPLIALSCESR
jgi:PAS domain S-box-containing protein